MGQRKNNLKKGKVSMKKMQVFFHPYCSVKLLAIENEACVCPEGIETFSERSGRSRRMEYFRP